MKRKKRNLFRNIVIVVLVVVVVKLIFFPSNSTQETLESKYLEYTVKQDTVESTYSYAGSISTDSKETIKSLTHQTIEEVRVEEGDVVNGETVLFVNDDGDRIYSKLGDEGVVGTIDTIYVSEGQDVTSGTNLITIIDYNDMQVTFNVDEYDILTLNEGDAVEIVVNATKEVIFGEITEISTTATTSLSKAYFTVTVDIEPSENVKIGMTVEANIINDRVINVPVILLDAITINEKNQATVLVKDSDGKMIEKDIEIGLVSGNYAQVVSGLEVGDTVYYKLITPIFNPFGSDFGEATTIPSGGLRPGMSSAKPIA